MNAALDFGDAQIPSNLLLQQLQKYQLLPQLVQEVILDELIERTAYRASLDLNYTQSEFAELFTKLEEINIFQGMNSQQLTAIAERQLKFQKFKQAGWGKDVEAYFTAQGRGLDRVVLSILQVPDLLQARELFFRIQELEQPFAEIVLDYSHGVHARDAGFLGPAWLRDLKPEIAGLILQLQPGEISPIFQLDNYFTFFRLEELEPAKLDDRMHQMLLEELFSKWLQSRLSIQVNR
jgi:parvulin-like peptidyl-prolyl isomerase